MYLRESAWHLRLWLCAFVRDRGWLEWWRVDLITGADELKEVQYFKKFERTMDRMDAKQCSHPKVQARLLALRQAADKARHRFYQEANRQKVAARGESNRQRLMQGRMSFCPYFWNVVSALFVYGLVVVPGRWFFRVAMPVIAKGVAVLLLVAFVLGSAYYGYKYRGKAQEVVSAARQDIHRLKSSWDYERAREQWFNEHKKQERREQIAWAQQHPDEVLRQKMLEEERKRRERVENQRRSKEEWATFWADVWHSLPGIGIVLLILTGSLVGITVVVSLLYLLVYLLVPELLRGLGWLLWQPFRFLIWVLGLIFVSVGQALEPVRSWWRHVWADIGHFASDTKALIMAFLKAKKERVCPLLTVVPAQE